MAAPTVNNVQSVGGDSSPSSVTESNYTPTAGSDKKLIVTLSSEKSAAQTHSVTWDGNAMEQVGSTNEIESGGTSGFSSIWYYDDPASSAGDIVGSVGVSGNAIGMCVATLLGAKSGAPEANNTNGSSSTNPVVTTITTITNDALMIQTMAGGSGGSVSFGGTETEHVANTQSNTLGYGLSSEAKATAGADSMSADQTSFNRIVATVIAVAPAGAVAANPKGPLGMPLHGPFGGPI